MDVILDGKPIRIPAECKSLGAIRTHLERLALAQERVLSHCLVDGRPANSSGFGWANNSFRSFEARTSPPADLASEILQTALRQTAAARTLVETAVPLVLINDAPLARELWCHLASQLKEPLLTLGLLPDSHYRQPDGCVSFQQMRLWQIEHYAAIIEQVNEASALEDTGALSNALEHRVLPWLQKLHDLIELWHQTALAGARILDRANPAAAPNRIVALQA
jgi:hypothetical protein